MREGNFLSWNTNSSLLKYYVEHVIEEEDMQAAELAIKAARQYAVYKNRNDLNEELLAIAKSHEIMLLDLEQSGTDHEDNNEVWFPLIDDYNPLISKETWLELLNNDDVFQKRHLLAMACMYDNGGEGSCTGLAEKYHQNMTLWRTTFGVHLAEKNSRCYWMLKITRRREDNFFRNTVFG